MLTLFIIASIVSIVAFVLVTMVWQDRFFGTVVPVIVSAVIGFIWTAAAIVAICTGNYKPGFSTLVIGLGMFARAYVEYQTMRDVQDFYARWGRRG